MTTEDEFLFLKKNEQSFVTETSSNISNQYSNLNLNQSSKCQTLISVHSCSIPYIDKFCVSDSYEGQERLHSENKSFNLNTLISNDGIEKETKNRLKTCSSYSTLSLHVSAYENSVEVVASDLSDGGSSNRIEKEKSWLIKKHKNDTQLFTVSSLIIQNPFEFPRQQSDKSTKPEVSEFKASQRLLNPKSQSANVHQRPTMALDCASNIVRRIEEQKALKRAASDDSGIESNSSTQKSGVVIPQKKYLGSPRSIFFNTEDNSGIAGLKKSLFDKYKEVRKIENLYPWQAEFLNDPRVIKGGNALLTAQTGGGKTLIAEILMLREIFNRNCSAIFVLPLVALVQEKILAFKALADAFHVRVEEYAAHKGRIPPIRRQDHRSLFVCTIEKASLLINSLMEKDQLRTIGLLVLDEVHMIGESGRGANLECLIAKYAAACSGQIVAMSATIGNAEQLANFLDGFHYHNSHRPVELKQYIAFDKTVYQVKKVEGLDPVRILQSKDPADPDGVLELALEIVPKHSVLIFCNSRAACENLCTLLFSKVTDELKKHKREERAAIVEELKAETDNQAAQGLKNALRVGIAYHHAGLMNCERQVVESAFHSGAISIVCATSTLAAGVNLPARRVIIRSPKVGISFMTKSQFLQMAGRAGRAGFDDIGECFVIGNDGKERVKKIIMDDPIPNCESQLDLQFESFILDLVGLGFVKYGKIKEVVGSTLYAIQNKENIDARLGEALDKLVETKFLVKPSEDEYGLDLYGRGKFHSGLSPEEIPTLIDHFTSHFEQGIVFKTRFSILYICVPFDIRVTVDWEVYRRQYLKLETCDQRMFGDLKTIETSIHKHQAENSQASIAEMRLYTALLVYRLCKLGMNSLYDCARTFKVAVGWIQQTYENMCHRAQALGRFSEHVNVMWPLKGLLPDLVNYMRSAGDEQIAQLMSVDGITRSMAHTLVKTTQFNTIGAIAKTTIPQLREALNGKLRKNLAERIIFSAKCVLRDAIDERKEEIAAMGGLLDEKIDDKLIE